VGNETPKMGKLMRLIGIVLLILVGLCGSTGITGKKRAWFADKKVLPPPIQLVG